MADAAITFGATDIFDLASLNANFVAQGSSNDDQATFATIEGADGDTDLYSGAFDEQNRVTGTYKWAATSGLNTELTVGDFTVGAVLNGYHVDSITFNTSNEDFIEIVVEGHNHDDNVHADGDLNEYSIPAGIISLLTGAFGGVDFFGNEGATTACQRSSYTISAEHNDVNDCVGDHFAGHTFKGLESASVDYVGDTPAGANLTVPDTVVWNVTSINANTSNEEFNTSTVTAERQVTRDYLT